MMNDKELRVYAEAIRFCIDSHGMQKRKYTQDPYWHHPISVATLLIENKVGDFNMVIAALLHDVVEDTDRNIEDISEAFGSDVANLVFWLTEKTSKAIGNRELRKSIDASFLSISPNRAKTIKVCDLIDNAKSIIKNDPRFAKVYMKEMELLIWESLVGADRNVLEIAEGILMQYYEVQE